MRRVARAPVVALGLLACVISGVGRAQVPTEPSPPPVATPPVPATIPVSGKPIRVRLPRRHEGKELAWDPAFNRMDAPEIVVTSVSAAVALATAIVPPLKTHWSGGILFDDQARNALRLSSYQARLDARDVSDVGLALVTSFPVLVDSLLVAYWYRGSTDVATQMTLIDAETFAVSAALHGAATFLGGRERPYGGDCGGAVPEQSIDCQSHDRYRSFYSGHSALSFTSASLICSHHMMLDLFDSPADLATCISGFVAAGAIATLRVVGDVHYASDVLTGAIVGTAAGLGIPLLHHYRKSSPDATSSGLNVRFIPAPTGAQIVGTF
jgi:membrane-associated phospholipid phosphatase